MGNMSHCRFENTSRDMEDCIESLRDKGINDLEKMPVVMKNHL